ncbi:MAG TPA: DNA-binding protein WhiA, partial [Solirubrobacterales bacterium]|nr:DNA-binding protein WhiA [Solirubrobacterales bacterium]
GVVGATRARANRLANADHANLIRTSRAAGAQLAAIRRLEVAGTLDDLPEPLRQAAELRLRYPSLSLGELAARADPPTTKAAVHRRLKRIQRLAAG